MSAWLVIVAAALIGAFLRAATSTAPTWTWQTAIDTAMGGIASVVVYVLLGILPWTAPTMAKLDTAWEQSLTVGVLSYIGSHVWVNRGSDWLAAFGDRMTGRVK